MKAITMYLPYLGISLFLAIEIAIFAYKPTPVMLGCMVFTFTNWIWILMLAKRVIDE